MHTFAIEEFFMRVPFPAAMMTTASSFHACSSPFRHVQTWNQDIVDKPVAEADGQEIRIPHAGDLLQGSASATEK
jgi:hypothetical protein